MGWGDIKTAHITTLLGTFEMFLAREKFFAMNSVWEIRTTYICVSDAPLYQYALLRVIVIGEGMGSKQIMGSHLTWQTLEHGHIPCETYMVTFCCYYSSIGGNDLLGSTLEWCINLPAWVTVLAKHCDLEQ